MYLLRSAHGYGGYVQPEMCKKHLDLAIVISLLKSRGYLASLENIRQLVDIYRPRLDLDLDEIAELLKPMREEAIRNGECDA